MKASACSLGQAGLLPLSFPVAPEQGRFRKWFLNEYRKKNKRLEMRGKERGKEKGEENESGDRERAKEER